jgi:hypothetical protein
MQRNSVQPTSPVPDHVIDRQSYLAITFLLVLAGLVFVISGGMRFMVPPNCQLQSQWLRMQPGFEAIATSRGGAPCVISARNTHANAEALEIITPPRNGRVDMRGKTGLIYVPNSQFRGQDSFNFRVLQRNASDSEADIVNMKINVDW